MSALGIPTTRSLASPSPPAKGLSSVRIERSDPDARGRQYIRVGTFQYLAARQDESNLRVLADYAIDRHYRNWPTPRENIWSSSRGHWTARPRSSPGGNSSDSSTGDEHRQHGYLRGRRSITARVRSLNACRSDTVFSSIDHAAATHTAINPRSRSGTSPASPRPCCRSSILTRRTRLPSPRRAWRISRHFRRVLARRDENQAWPQTSEESDIELIQSLFGWMQKSGADFTTHSRPASESAAAGDRYQDPAFQTWHSRWQLRLSVRPGRCFGHCRDAGGEPGVIPRNHRVEEHFPPRRITTICRCCIVCWQHWRRRTKREPGWCSI